MKNNTVAEIAVSYSFKTPISQKKKVISSRDAYEVFRSNWNMDLMQLQEEFKIIMLNRANLVIGIYSLSKGGSTSTVVDCKLIFSVALKCAANSIVLGHNHPSSNLFPSLQDIVLTKKIIAGAKLLDIKVIDHIILTSESYYSFADEGKLDY